MCVTTSVFYAFHSFLVEVQTKMATYVWCMRNSNLEIMIAGSSCRLQKYIISILQIDNKHNIASFSKQIACRLHEDQTIIVLGSL